MDIPVYRSTPKDAAYPVRANVLLLDTLAMTLFDMRRNSIAAERLAAMPRFQYTPVPEYGDVVSDDGDLWSDTESVHSPAEPRAGAGAGAGTGAGAGAGAGARGGASPGPGFIAVSVDGESGKGADSRDRVEYTSEDRKTLQALLAAGAVTRNSIVHRAFPAHTIPRAMELETFVQTTVRQVVVSNDPGKRCARRYRVAPKGWVDSAQNALWEWVVHSSTGVDPQSFSPRLEEGLVADILRPGDVMAFLRYIQYRKVPVQAGIRNAMERGYAPYPDAVYKYVTGTCYGETLDLARSLLSNLARSMLETFNSPSHRYHVRTVVALLTCFFNRTHTGVLDTFLVTPDAIHTILSHTGPTSGPVLATKVANLPIIVWVDNVFHVVYLDHIAAVTRNVYTAFVHWMWLFVHVAQPTSRVMTKLREALLCSFEFLSVEVADVYTRAPDKSAGVSASARASAGVGADTGEGASSSATADASLRKPKRVRIDDIQETLELQTQTGISDRGLTLDGLLG